MFLFYNKDAIPLLTALGVEIFEFGKNYILMILYIIKYTILYITIVSLIPHAHPDVY